MHLHDYDSEHDGEPRHRHGQTLDSHLPAPRSPQPRKQRPRTCIPSADCTNPAVRLAYSSPTPTTITRSPTRPKHPVGRTHLAPNHTSRLMARRESTRRPPGVRVYVTHHLPYRTGERSQDVKAAQKRRHRYRPPVVDRRTVVVAILWRILGRRWLLIPA